MKVESNLSYMLHRNLEIWKLARSLTIDVHRMTLQLPSFEQYEEARQLRRSVKSVRSNIVEGCHRQKYRKDYVRFIIYALSSNEESIDHLEILYETGSLKDKQVYEDLHKRFRRLGIKIQNFLRKLEED